MIVHLYSITMRLEEELFITIQMAPIMMVEEIVTNPGLTRSWMPKEPSYFILHGKMSTVTAFIFASGHKHKHTLVVMSYLVNH